jgi:hypothetical protein
MYLVGLDLGKKQDYSAVAVVEREDRQRAFLPAQFQSMRVQYLERMALGTPYVEVVNRVGAILAHPLLQHNCRLAVDATGVGAPVLEMLRAARLPCRPTAVTVTGGEHAHGGGGEWSVPKKDLMAGLLVLLENGELRIPRELDEAGTLLKELMDVKFNQRSGGRVAMGAEGYGQHDDLAFALALACWRARQKEIGFGTQRLI